MRFVFAYHEIVESPCNADAHFGAERCDLARAGTLATLIASYSSPEGLFWAKLSAASLMAVAPIVVFGWFSQKQLVQGLTFGAVK